MLKLIRDRLADLDWPVEPQLKKYVRPVRDRDEHGALLRSKLFEEIAELLNAHSNRQLTEELCDVLTVLRAIAGLSGIDWPEVERWAARKREQRGGFENGTVLEF